MNKDNQFFDSKTIIAIALVMVVWLGWQKYLSSKYPQMNKPVATADKTATPPVEGQAPAVPAKIADQKALVEKNDTEEKTLLFENEDVSFQVSSFGMAVKEVHLKKYTTREKSVVILGEKGLFEIKLLGSNQPLAFSISRKDESDFSGVAKVGGMTIVQELSYNTQNNAFRAQLFVQNAPANFLGLRVGITEKKLPAGTASFLMPSFEHQEFVLSHQGNLERINITSSKESIDKVMPQASFVSVGSQYFSTIFKDKSAITPEAKLTSGTTSDNVTAEMIYKPATRMDNMEFNWIGYAGPKSLTKLQGLDVDLAPIVNFGFFSMIGRFLFVLLNLFHNFVGNWGLAIIILTIIVRLVVLPFNITSYKSMKKMQQIQPMIQSLRERYKDDPQTMNAETMKLFKAQKVNPIGGCLPMLLQMPVFFALYQVLGQSIELYQAPFFGWIHDLSLKDPYYVLPALMGISMFVQQKITPTTMDPAQAKIMQFLPIVFALMMISLPSGLTLYIFVSTLFGIIQQQLFMKTGDKKVATGG